MFENRDSAIPVVPVAAARPSRGLAGIPLLALCCLLCTLLVIASTIVLALIPVYVQAADSQRAATRGPYYTNFDAGTPVNDGALDANAQTATRNALAAGLNTNQAGVGIQAANAVTTPTGKRRRRALQQRDRRVVVPGFGIQLIYITFVIFTTLCVGTACTFIPPSIIFPAFTLIINGITINVASQTSKISGTNPNVSPNSAVTISTTTVSTTSTASTARTTTTTASSVTTGMVNG